jgi:hypothetical protein
MINRTFGRVNPQVAGMTVQMAAARRIKVLLAVLKPVSNSRSTTPPGDELDSK